MAIEDQIQAALDLANGNRRVRTLDLESIIELIYEAKRDGKARVGGGNAVRSFGYESLQTVAEATSDISLIVLSIGVNRAAKGSAQRPNPKWLEKQTTLVLHDIEVDSLI